MITVLRYVTFVLLVCLVSTKVQQTLRIGAFNIQTLGPTKMSRERVVDCITETITRYDVILIQEIRNKHVTHYNLVSELLREVNSVARLTNSHWAVTVSGNLGQNNPERYAYFYKTNTTELVNVTQWRNKEYRVFARPPYIARFKSTVQPSFEFGFIGIHTRPTSNGRKVTIMEINGLANVYDEMSGPRYWNLKDFIIGGDFNAERGLSTPSLRKGRFQWTIDDNVATTLSGKPLDRFVLAGTRLKASFVEGSAKAYKYWRSKPELDCESLATSETPKKQRISDHFPIELKLRPDNANSNSRMSQLRKQIRGVRKSKRTTTVPRTKLNPHRRQQTRSG